MITKVYFDDFCRMFAELRPNNFSFKGLRALFDYLEEWEDGTGEELEFDVIAICCDFHENSLEEYIEERGLDVDFFNGLSDDEMIDKIEELSGCDVISLDPLILRD